MNTEEILNIKFECQDLRRVVSIREYFFELLKTLWLEEEGFSGKRPFGNSGWTYEIVACLIKNKLIPGTLDEYGYVEKCDNKQADNFIVNNILKPLMLYKP